MAESERTEPEPKEPDAQTEVLEWWKDLIAPTEAGKPSRAGESAALRRCKDLEEVLFVPAYQQLFYRASRAGWKDRIRIAAIAGLLAYVKEDVDKPASIGAFLATPKKPGLGPRVSEQRFRRLVAIKDITELYSSLLRVIHLAGDKVPVRDLIHSVRFWSTGERNRISSEWTFRYYDSLISGKNPG